MSVDRASTVEAVESSNSIPKSIIFLDYLQYLNKCRPIAFLLHKSMSRFLRDLKYGNSNLQFLQNDRSVQNYERRILINVCTSKTFEIAQSPRFSWGTMSWRTQISLGRRRLKLPLVLILIGMSYYNKLIIKKQLIETHYSYYR